MLAFDDVEAADAGADVNADHLGVRFIDDEAGVLHGLLRGGHGEVDEAAHLAGLLLVHEDVGVKVLDLGGEANGVAGEIVGGDLGHAAATGEQALPDLLGGVADPADQAHARDHDTSLQHLSPIPSGGSCG